VDGDVRVRVLAFAGLRDVLGFGMRELTLARPATIASVWDVLVRDVPGLAPFRASTRFARNGALADDRCELASDDEVALLPPVGGG
jgi:molybdopterin converting factor small subunit